ncbi:MAG TPA: hypothetical protein VJQ51_09025 [Burkholderiales bacterium]|nr:hypothetical protein [Burkholderiales bacterium]
MKLKLEKQEDLIPWIPIVVPMLAVLLAVCIFLLDASILAK